MSNFDFQKILNSISPQLGQVGDEELKKQVSSLLNLVENVLSKIRELQEENQQLKDEINKLKGEKGRPKFKEKNHKDDDPSGDGNISSEKERKKAENIGNEKPSNESFKIDLSSLEDLKKHHLLDSILALLEKMKGESFSNITDFLNCAEKTIGGTLTEEQRKILIKFASYKKRNRNSKIAEIFIDRVVPCSVDRSQIPADAVFKCYTTKVVQDVIIKTDNIEFCREVYYSPSMKKTYIGPVPKGYEGEFGPHINSSIFGFKYVGGMTIPKIKEFLKNIGVGISGTYISQLLTKPRYMDIFNQEVSDLQKVALEISKYIQIDDTGSKVCGVNHYTQILCNDFYTIFITTKNKDRLTILDILRNNEERAYLINENAIPLLRKLNISGKDIEKLLKYAREKRYTELEFDDVLNKIFVKSKSKNKRLRVREGCAINNYRQETGISAVEILLCDDAPQFKLLTELLALCWVHVGRHCKKLNPFIPTHQKELESFLGKFWDYYSRLIAYKKNPDATQAEVLSLNFDILFQTKTGYDALDDRIEKIRDKKAELLVVLSHPEIPLHNNRSENGARVEKRRQDASLQTITKEGTKAKDTLMSTCETLKKLGISAYKYFFDRISGKYEMPSIAEMLKEKMLNKSFTLP